MLKGYFLFQIKPFENHYLLRHRDVPIRSKRSAHHHTRRLEKDGRVSTSLPLTLEMTGRGSFYLFHAF